MYLNIYSFKNLYIYKNYFFLSNKYFTHKNFIYFYNQFLIDNKINVLFVFDLKIFVNFSHNLEQLDIILFTFNNNFDFFKNNYNISINLNFFSTFYYILLFNFVWFLSINYISFNKKLFYLNNFNYFNKHLL